LTPQPRRKLPPRLRGSRRKLAGFEMKRGPARRNHKQKTTKPTPWPDSRSRTSEEDDLAAETKVAPNATGQQKKICGVRNGERSCREVGHGEFFFSFFFFFLNLSTCSSNGKESKPLRELGAHWPSPANEEEPLWELGAYGPSPGDE